MDGLANNLNYNVTSSQPTTASEMVKEVAKTTAEMVGKGVALAILPTKVLGAAIEAVSTYVPNAVVTPIRTVTLMPISVVTKIAEKAIELTKK